MRLGEDVPDYALRSRVDAQGPADCCTLIYTSGTTGDPKAVMVSHDNLTWMARNTANCIRAEDHDVMVSYLPLSHIAAQIVDIHLPMAVGSAIWFAQPDALKGTIKNTLQEVMVY